MTDSPLDRDLEQMAGGRRLAGAVKRSLEELKHGVAGPDLAEMATEVLEARTNLRTVVRSSAYSTQVTNGIDHFTTWEAGLSPEEREQFEEEQRKILSEDS
jgi:hypothetical protein